MIKNELPCFYVLDELQEHNDIKDILLKEFDSMEKESLVAKNAYYDDNITKLSWKTAEDFEEPWKKILMESLGSKLQSITESLGYQHYDLYQLWFQQYFENDIHGWHIHGHNMTGVYYLELPENAPKTEIVAPFNQTEIIVPEIKEGSILLFPSFTIHRAPKIKSDLRKTIVSFNMSFDLIRNDILVNISSKSENT